MASAMYSGGRVRTNMPAMNAYNALIKAGQDIAMAQLRLSTGKRINSAADDVAGYITSRSLMARNGSLRVAKQAAGDAKNVTAIAQDSLEQIGDILTQIKDSAAQASAGALGTDEKISLAKSAFRLAQQIQFITDSTVFGGHSLLDGNFKGDWVTGYSANNNIMTIGIDLNFNNAGSYGSVSAKNNSMYNVVSGSANPFSLNATGDQLGSNATASGSFGGVTGLNLKDLDSVSADDLGIFSAENIQTTLKSLSIAINNVNKVATYLGGIQVRLDSQEQTLTSQITNYKSAISRIEDTDIAETQMKLIQAQFLQNASLISLAQANQNPNDFLSLLRG
ncbi:MAG: flagellin [Ignavibacteria bacterium]|jgi:flagellin|nr:flagellin [Ignavibacteria bacterium]